MPNPDDENAAAQVRKGWAHYQLQRPLAAWAAWQRALAESPESVPAQQALAILERAPELPAAARTALRFRPPGLETRRERWDARLRDRNMANIAAASEAFSKLASEDPRDDAAWYNYALCLAWQGLNLEAIDALDRVVRLIADSNLDSSVDAWALAEILRQGEESQADDLTYACIIRCDEDVADEILAPRPELQSVPAPLDPDTGRPQFANARAYTWLDRGAVAGGEALLRVADLPRVLAQVLRLPGTLRLSSPDPQSLERVFTEVINRFVTRLPLIRREAAPLRLALMDAAVWTFRLPPGLDPESSAQLSRSAVEHHYENLWIHVPRHGLDDRTPLEASRRAMSGDSIARARLLAVVRLREQLGQRPLTAGLYQGYPFDRLRRRLGLEPVDPGAVDPDDVTCMSGDDLRKLDPASLDAPRLIEAYESASSLRDDSLAAQFAVEVLRRGDQPPAGLDVRSVIATLVREALKSNDPDEALRVVDRGRAVDRGRDGRTYDVWSAEIHSRTGAPDAAVRVYQGLLDQDPDNAFLALDAAETLIDNGYSDHALPMLSEARARAVRIGDTETARRAEALLGRLADEFKL